jgi:hypothetical protein
MNRRSKALNLLTFAMLIGAWHAGTSLGAQEWSPWMTTATFSKDKEGFESFKTLNGLDSNGRKWTIEWARNGVIIHGPDGVTQGLGGAFPTEAHPRGGMSISRSDIQLLKRENWEFQRVLIDTGRNGIALYYFIFIAQELKTKAWKAIGGRVADENLEDPVGDRDGVILRWADEHDERPLVIHHQARVNNSSGQLKLLNMAPTYQLMYGYPVWCRFWADDMSDDPDVAENTGWLSVAWKLGNASLLGGSATSERNSIPRKPGRQVWKPGSGGDVWFPMPGQVEFTWPAEVEIRAFMGKYRRVSPKAAFRLATTNAWDVVLTRESDGTFRGAMLIENHHRKMRKPRLVQKG